MQIPSAIYDNIVKSMPIPCVDLLVRDPVGRVLLLRRRNPPAEGHWWFPGGRVHFGERREAAARRKLAEECGLEATSLTEMGTFDLLLDDGVGHAITTVFEVAVDDTPVRLDDQSSEWAWRPVRSWLTEALHPFVAQALTRPALNG